jgi:hypothetical protein
VIPAIAPFERPREEDGVTYDVGATEEPGGVAAEGVVDGAMKSLDATLKQGIEPWKMDASTSVYVC